MNDADIPQITAIATISGGTICFSRYLSYLHQKHEATLSVLNRWSGIGDEAGGNGVMAHESTFDRGAGYLAIWSISFVIVRSSIQAEANSVNQTAATSTAF